MKTGFINVEEVPETQVENSQTEKDTERLARELLV
jgi:hypothetical protein